MTHETVRLEDKGDRKDDTKFTMSGFGRSLVGAQEWPPRTVRVKARGLEEEKEVPSAGN